MKRSSIVLAALLALTLGALVFWSAWSDWSGQSGASAPSHDGEGQAEGPPADRLATAQTRVTPKVAVEAPPDFASVVRQGSAAQPVPPEGYSFVSANAQVRSGRAGDSRQQAKLALSNDDWLAPLQGIESILEQSRMVGRDYAFGYLRLVRGAAAAEVFGRLASLDVEVLGVTGAYIRARLPGSRAQLESILDLPQIDGLGAVPHERKLPANFLQEPQERPTGSPQPVFVTLVPDDPSGIWAGELQARGVVVGRYHADIRTYEASASPETLRTIAQADFVLSVEPVGTVEPAHDTSVPAMGGDALRQYNESTGLFSGTAGGSVAIGVMDTGLNTRHMDIASGRASICGANFVRDEFWFFGGQIDEQYDLWFDAQGHGTHVTGTILGSGSASAQHAGMAPAVSHLRFAKVLSRSDRTLGSGVLDGMDFLAQSSGCLSKGSVSMAAKPLIVNMSLGASALEFEGRSASERKLDSIVWNHRQLYVVAQANEDEGGFSNYAAAKGSLAVGAVSDSGEIASFSSHGPTADGRLAPQVVASGVAINSARGAGSRTGYVESQGTSMAAPAVSGVAALLYDAVPDARTTPAIARALLMATAVKPDPALLGEAHFARNNTSGPRSWQNQYGLGRVSARAAVLNKDDAAGWTSGFAVMSLEDGDNYKYVDITVPPNASRLDVVVTWDEPAADTLSNSVLNDIDLWVDHGADCAATLANCGEHSSRSAVDNVEWVIISDPAAGTYRLKVVADQIYSDNQVAIAWNVIRGNDTPQLAVSSDAAEVRAGSRAAYEVNLTVTADEYIAAGATLQLGCRTQEANPDCTAMADTALISGQSTVIREDGIARSLESSPFSRPIALGEIAAGESQTIKLVFRNGVWDPSHRLYAVATSWNARSDSTSLAVNLYENRSDAVPPPALTPLPNADFAQAIEVSQTSGSLDFDFLLASREPGEPIVASDLPELSDEAYEELKVRRSLWYKWITPETANARYSITAVNANPEDQRTERIKWDVFVGDESGALAPVFSHVGTWIFSNGKGKAGDVLYFRLSAASANVKPRILRWESRKIEPPANDAFAAPDSIEGEAGSKAGENTGATLEHGEDLGGLAASVWYRWRAPSSGHFNFSVRRTSSARLRVMVFKGDSVTSLRLVSGDPSWPSASSLDGSADFLAREGVEYRIAVVTTGADDFLSSGNFELKWSAHSKDLAYLHWWSRNDHFSGARQISGTNTNYRVSSPGYWTVEPGEPAQTGSRTQWLSWAPPSSGEYTWRLYTRHKISFFSGTSLDNLELIAESDPRFSSRPEIKVDVTAGTRYWIALGLAGQDAFRSAPAPGWLYWGRTPANDDQADAATLTGGNGSAAASTLFATLEANEPSNTAGHQSLWWKWKASDDGWRRFWLDGRSLEDGVLSLYEQGAGGALKLVATSEMSYALNGASELAVDTEAGKTYVLRLASQGHAFGNRDSFTLHWDQGDEPIWLRYAGRITDGDPALTEKGVDLRSPGSLVFNSGGDRLYVAGQQGLAVFDRDAESGALAPLQFIWNGDPAADSSYFYTSESSPLLWDATRLKLFAGDPFFARLQQLKPNDDNSGLDLEGATPSSDGVQPLAGIDRLIMDTDGEYIHMLETTSANNGVTLEWVILTFSVDSSDQTRFVPGVYFSEFGDYVSGLRFERALRGLKDAVLSVDARRLYAVTPNSVLAFNRDKTNGTLALSGQTDFRDLSGLPISFEGAAIGLSPDGQVLAVVGAEDAQVARFDLRSTPGRPEFYDVMTGFAKAPGSHATFVQTQRPQSCTIGLARNDSGSGDVICENVIYSVMAGAEGLQATDYLAEWQSDRFGNEIPAFGVPRSAVGSPDGRHLYLTGEEGDQILIFERIGGREAPDE